MRRGGDKIIIVTQSIHRRNIRFKNEIAVADKSKILGVAIDSSNNFHRVIIFNFLGKKIGRPFSVDIRKKGFEALVKKIEKAKHRIRADKVCIAIESAGSYSENLFNHLLDNYDNVFLVSAVNVAHNRKQKSLLGLKTDDIDCCSIGDLLIRGEFYPQREQSVVYYQLKSLVSWYLKKQDVLRALNNQVWSRLKYIYPGLYSQGEDEESGLKSGIHSMLYKGIINHPMTGQEFIQYSNEGLSRLFGYKNIRHALIERFKRALKELLLPAEPLARAHISILQRDVNLINRIEHELEGAENQIIKLGKQTPAKNLMGQVRGLTDLDAAVYIGLVGDVSRFKSAKQIFSFSGLAPRISQSGGGSKVPRISRVGSPLLRRVLFRLAKQVALHERIFSEYSAVLRKRSGKHWKSRYIAVARKLNNVFFALMRDNTSFRNSQPLAVRPSGKAL